MRRFAFPLLLYTDIILFVIATCSICPGGYSCAVGTIDPVACGVGYYSDDASAMCTRCKAGYYCDSNTTSWVFMINNRRCQNGTVLASRLVRVTVHLTVCSVYRYLLSDRHDASAYFRR